MNRKCSTCQRLLRLRLKTSHYLWLFPLESISDERVPIHLNESIVYTVYMYIWHTSASLVKHIHSNMFKRQQHQKSNLKGSFVLDKISQKKNIYLALQDGSGCQSLIIQTVKKQTTNNNSEDSGIISSLLRRSRSKELSAPPPPESSTDGLFVFNFRSFFSTDSKWILKYPV